MLIFATQLCWAYNTEGNKIILTTQRDTGNWVMKIITLYGVSGSDGVTWIDWNNNNRYEEGEEIIQGTKFFEHELDAKTITIYGDIRFLSCNRTQLTDADLSQCPTLSTLDVSVNNLKHLDLSHQKSLRYLYCERNDLTELDLSGKPELLFVRCLLNNLSKEQFLKMANDLNDRSELFHGQEQSVGDFYPVDLRKDVERNVCPKEAVDLLKSKNWRIWAFPNYDDPEQFEDEYGGEISGVEGPVINNASMRD